MKKPAIQGSYWWLWITGALAILVSILSADSGSAMADFFRGVALGIGIGAILIGFWVYIRDSQK
ncbi:MAG: hypothetical protein WEA61_03520 [Anaerolineales bacterium]